MRPLSNLDDIYLAAVARGDIATARNIRRNPVMEVSATRDGAYRRNQDGSENDGYSIREGGRWIGDLTLRIDPDGTATIGQITMAGGRKPIGISGVNVIREQIKKDYPQIKQWAGVRTTGARSGKTSQATTIQEPTTRDSQGNVIPLSKRFNPRSNIISNPAQEIQARRYAAKTGDDFRRVWTLMGWLTEGLDRTGNGRSSYASDGRLSFHMESASTGSDYVTVSDEQSGEQLRIRYSDHFARGGGGYRVSEMGSGRSSPPDYNVVRGKIHAYQDGKWVKIGLAAFRNDLLHFLNYGLP